MGVVEWLIILVIVVVLFGASKLPGLGAGLGKAIRNFKDASSGGSEGTENRKGGVPPGGAAS